MGLQLAKSTPLANISVQPANYVAGNINVPAPQAPVTTPNIAVNGSTNYYQSPQGPSWNAPTGPTPVQEFINAASRTPIVGSAFNTLVSIPRGMNNSIAANAFRLGTANLTHNPIAASNARMRVSQASDALNANLKDPRFLAGAFGEGGLEKPGEIPKPEVKLNGKNISKPTSGEPPDFLKTSPGYVEKTPTDMGQVPTAQMKPLDTPETNTAKNPYKADVPVVEQGNFPQVVANEQAVSRPVQNAGSVWQQDMKNLYKSNPTEANNFWRYFKDPGFADAPKSPQLQRALNSWKTVADRIHGNSQALGGNTNYLEDYGLHPTLFNDEVTGHLTNGGNPDKFPGLNNLSRKHATIAELEAAAQNSDGAFKVGTDPLKEGTNYINASATLLRRRAIVKGAAEADAGNLTKTHNLSLGPDHNIPLSAKAVKELRGLQRSTPSDNKVVKGLRTANVGAKSTLLSFGQFHPINISGLRAAPTLAIPKPSMAVYRNAETGKLGIDPTMGAHPVRAVKGLAKTFRPLLPGGKNAASNEMHQAVKEGLDTFGAKIGAPLNQEFLDSEGSNIAGVGHGLLGRQMFGMHTEALRAIKSDLERRGISVDSAQARTAGKAVNNLMGFVNDEAQKIPPQVSRKMGDWLLARQFTHSKFSQLRTGATEGGVGGAYARANVAANVAATTAVIGAIGYLYNQKSDNVKDLLIRALVDPAAPTNLKDSKGNTVKMRTPGTDASDVSKLLGFKAVRNSDGHLGISWKPGNMPTTISDYLRARLAPLGSAGVKIATNQNYAGKPLYDPNAPIGTKIEQGATTIGSGLLPIGAQGLPQVGAIKSHLPGNVQDVLNAQKPGNNPLLKSVGSSFGLTPSTDQTVGKGKDTAQYYDAVDKFKQGLDRQSQDAYDLWTGSKKNPVTGKYDVNPSYNDPRTKASALLQNPKALNSIISLNQSLAKQGQKVDPLWGLSKDQITSYLQYQNMPPGSADKTDWYNKNQSWYAPLVSQRNSFFSSLPAGDPNKPKLDLQYPQASNQVGDLMNQYSSITDAKAKGAFLDAHPEIIQQFNAQADYTNKLRQQLGYSPFKNYPEPSTQLQGFMSTYNNASKAQRASIRNSSPQQYQNMISYYDSLDMYNINKQGATSELQGEPDYTSKQAKAISSVAQDIYQNPDSTYSIQPAGWMQGLSNSSGSSNSSKSKTYTASKKTSSKSSSSSSGGSSSGRAYVSRSAARLANPYGAMVQLDAGGKPHFAKLNKSAGKKSLVKVAKLSGKSSIALKGKPVVSTKKSLV